MQMKVILDILKNLQIDVKKDIEAEGIETFGYIYTAIDELIAELEALENKSCENCKYKLQNECSANFLIVCKRHPRLPDHYEESK